MVKEEYLTAPSEDGVFARMLRDSGHMEERDFKTYMELFQNMSNFMKKPNIIVHLDVCPEESFRRIEMRKRECESGIPLDYLKSLHAAYEVFIKDIARVIPVIKVDYQRFRTAQEMAQVIKREYQLISNVRNVKFDDVISSPLKDPTIPTGGYTVGTPVKSPPHKKLNTGEDAKDAKEVPEVPDMPKVVGGC